jgi:hypothetical protein
MTVIAFSNPIDAFFIAMKLKRTKVNYVQTGNKILFKVRQLTKIDGFELLV